MTHQKNPVESLREDGEHLTRFAEVAKGLGLSKLIANKLANFIHYEVIKMKKDTISSHHDQLLAENIGIIDKFIDDNDDGIWSGRETADRIRTLLLAKKKQ